MVFRIYIGQIKFRRLASLLTNSAVQKRQRGIAKQNLAVTYSCLLPIVRVLLAQGNVCMVHAKGNQGTSQVICIPSNVHKDAIFSFISKSTTVLHLRS